MLSNQPKSHAVPVKRNARLFDNWSLVHFTNGVWISWLFPALIAWLIMAAWEPLETQIISPLLLRRGIVFGYEALPNSLSDIVFDGFGIIVGTLLAHALHVTPLFFR